MSKFTLERDLVVFDLETTGLDLQKDEIVQFAAIRWHENKGNIEPVSELQFYCKPSILIPKEASDIHGITDEKVKESPSFKDFVTQVQDIFLGADIAGYNIINFDVHILNRQMKENAVEGFLDSFFFYDSYKVYVDDCPRNLENAYKHYTGKQLQNAHDALADVSGTSEVIFQQISKRGESLRSISESHSVPPASRVGLTDHIIKVDGNFVINFGKWAGTPVEKVQKGYIFWIVTKSDLPKAIKDFMSKYL